MCYLSPTEQLDFKDYPIGNHGKWPRCRTMSNDDPLFATPHPIKIAEAKRTHFCIGDRAFKKKAPCNISTGKKWSTACIMSILAGGFGGDRFYLNYWRSAIGKLLTFGGLGIWTIVDIFLVCTG